MIDEKPNFVDFKQRQLWQYRPFRFVVVGLLNTLFGYGVYAALVLFDIEYHLALTLATLTGIFFNFKTTGVIVFENRDLRPILKFFFGYLLVYSVNLVLLTAIVGLIENKIVSQGVCLPLVVPLSYAINKRFVFS